MIGALSPEMVAIFGGPGTNILGSGSSGGVALSGSTGMVLAAGSNENVDLASPTGTPRPTAYKSASMVLTAARDRLSDLEAQIARVTTAPRSAPAPAAGPGSAQAGMLGGGIKPTTALLVAGGVLLIVLLVGRKKKPAAAGGTA